MSSLPPLPPSAPLPPPTQTYPIPIAHATRRSPSPYRGGGSMRDDPYAYGSRGDSYIPGGSMPVGGFMGGEGGFGGAPGGPGGMAMYRRDSFGRDRPPRDAYLADRRQHRSRSPPPHYDTGRFPPRNGRSRSPSRERFFDRDRRDRDRDLERDRDDRPRYRDDRREPNSSGGRPIDPEALENMVSFRPFSEWVRMSQPELVLKDEEEAKSAKPGEKSGMSLRFEEYKKKFTSRQLWALYLVHRNEAWFQERYSMEEKDVEARKNETKKGRGRTVAGFFAELERGEWDGIDYTEEDGMEDVKMKDDNNDKPQRRAPDNGVISASDRDLVNIEPEPNQIFLKTIGPDIPRSEIEEVINKKSPGFEYLALSEPASKRSFHRVGWAQFSEGTDMDNVVRLLDGMELRHFTFHIVRNTIPFTGKIRYTPTFASTLERLRHDYQQAKAMAIALERGVLGEDEIQGSAKIDQRIQEVWKRSGLIGELTPEQEREIVRISLDLYIAYLRNGLNTCYYCVAPNDHQEELKRRCIRHVRRAAVGPSVVSNAENEKNGKADDGDDDDIPGGRGNGARDGGKLEASSAKWAENVDSKVKLVTAPELVNPVDYNGKSFEEESRKISQLHIKQEEATKFRCKLCAKLFKAPEFLFKHVPTKHPKEFEELEKTLPVFNAFALDPQRVQPAFSQPASVDDKLPIQPVHPPLPPPGGISTPRSDRERRPRQSVGRGGGMSGTPRGVGGGFGGGGFRGPPLVTRIGPEGHEDPRASRGQVSYKDLDAVPSGDVMGLPY